MLRLMDPHIPGKNLLLPVPGKAQGKIHTLVQISERLSSPGRGRNPDQTSAVDIQSLC